VVLKVALSLLIPKKQGMKGNATATLPNFKESAIP
jgi:hypothetical protein